MTQLWILAALAAIAAAYFAGAVLIPLLFALFLAILLEPLVGGLKARGLPRGVAAGAVVIAFLIGAGGTIWACAQPFSNIVTEMPQYRAKIRTAVSELERKTRSFAAGAGLPGSQPSAAPRKPASGSEAGEGSWEQFIWRGLGSFFEAAGIAAFVPFLMFVMLIEKDLLIDAFKRLAGSSCDIGMIDRETAQMVRSYFYGNLVAGAVMAALHWALFLGFGLRNAVGLGLVAGIITLIPLIGLPGALLLPIAQGLLQFDKALPFVLLAACMTALHLLNANYVIPRVIGGRVKINSTAATAGLLFWGWMWGVTGFVLAVPLTALLKILLESRRGAEGYARLLAAEPGEPRAWFGRRWLARSRRHGRALASR